MSAIDVALESLRAQRSALDTAIKALEEQSPEVEAPSHHCDVCDADFVSAQALSLHRRRSAEHRTNEVHQQARAAAASASYAE